MSTLETSVLPAVFDLVHSIYSKSKQYTLFGEWCGPGIQRGVGINHLSAKHFVVFAVRAGDEWLDIRNLRLIAFSDYNIYCIHDFPNWMVEIDFNQPELVQNRLVEYTSAVEAECPVAKQLADVSGIGEGIVWKPVDTEYSDSRYWFKVKGEKHSVSKVSKLVEVDVEAIARKDDLIAAIVTENRLEQGLQIFLQEHAFELRNIGHYLRWVFADVMKEESDRVAASGFTHKDLGKPISDIAKRYFLTKANKSTTNSAYCKETNYE